MLLKILRFFNLDITGRSWQEMAEHDYFGEIVFFGFREKDKCYWECMKELDGVDVFIGINSPDGLPPSDEHVRFVELVIADLDNWFAIVASGIVPDFESRFSRKFAADWKEQISFAGMVLPYDLEEGFNWDLMFEVNEALGSLDYICHMKGQDMVDVTVDG